MHPSSLHNVLLGIFIQACITLIQSNFMDCDEDGDDYLISTKKKMHSQAIARSLFYYFCLATMMLVVRW